MESLRLVDKLHEYLKNHNMEKLIPRECLTEHTPERSRNAKKRVRNDNMMNEFRTLDGDNLSTTKKPKSILKSSPQTTT